MPKMSDFLGKNKTEIAVITVIIIVIGFISYALYSQAESYYILIIPILGLVSFFIPLLLSFSSKYNLGTKLSKGEVRKSIVISLTVMYILLLSLSFYSTKELTTNAPYNAIYNATINTTAQSIPIKAIGNFTQNFLYVYIIIIGFYFGSRFGERIKMLKELKNLKPLEILQKRYAMGEIDSDTFDDMKERLAEHLFSIDTKFEKELNTGGSISEELKKEFEKNRFLLPDNAAVTKKEEKKWVITYDKKVIISIRKEEGKLNIYKNHNDNE